MNRITITTKQVGLKKLNGELSEESAIFIHDVIADPEKVSAVMGINQDRLRQYAEGLFENPSDEGYSQAANTYVQLRKDEIE